jgi:hypothetical protein
MASMAVAGKKKICGEGFLSGPIPPVDVSGDDRRPRSRGRGGAVKFLTSTSIRKRTSMKIKPNVKTGAFQPGPTNNNKPVARSLKVKSAVKSGAIYMGA